MSLRKALYLLLCLSVYAICLWVLFSCKKTDSYSLVSKDDYMVLIFMKHTMQILSC